MRENNRAARAARTILEYFDAVCQANDKVKVLTPNSKSFIRFYQSSFSAVCE